MDGDMWEQHLALAERHIADGESTLARQRQLVAELDRDGHDTAQARALLAQFQHLQDLHVADRDRIRSEIEHQRRQREQALGG